MSRNLFVGVLAVAALWANGSLAEEAAAIDGAQVESLTGLKGALNKEENVFKVLFPRADLANKVDQVAMAPFMGFTSWAAFTPAKDGKVMVMGDLVLLEDEVNPVMSILLDNDVQVTALHNHFFYDDPKVFFMHIGSEGKLDKMAAGVGKAIAKCKELIANRKGPSTGFDGPARSEKNAITPAPLEAALGAKATAKDGMCKFVWGRKTKMDCGCDVGKEMGVNTWAAFAGSDESAVVCGDFAVLETELQAVLKSLRTSGVNIVAIHHHMVGETPRTIFLHYWGRGKAEDLAKAVKAALDTQAK